MSAAAAGKRLRRRARSNRGLLALVFGLIAAGMSSSVGAHDIDVTGVARLVLDEILVGENADGEPRTADYRLSLLDAKVPPLYDIAGSIPSRCRAQASGIASYRFRCSPALSRSESLLFPWGLAGVVIIANWSDGSSHSRYYRGDGVFVEAPLEGLRAASGDIAALAGNYLVLGIEHILLGIDHLLFVIGLLLLLWQRGNARLPNRAEPTGSSSITWLSIQALSTFTVAHSLTLGASILGFASAPAAPVELLIALSVVMLARESLVDSRTATPAPKIWPLAFLFGLIHGFGFAGALGDLGLNSADIPIALFFFNIGVELGQLFIVTLSFGVVWTARRLLPHLEDRANSLQRGLSYGLGGIAVFWLIERAPSLIS